MSWLYLSVLFLGLLMGALAKEVFQTAKLHREFQNVSQVSGLAGTHWELKVPNGWALKEVKEEVNRLKGNFQKLGILESLSHREEICEIYQAPNPTPIQGAASDSWSAYEQTLRAFLGETVGEEKLEKWRSSELVAMGEPNRLYFEGRFSHQWHRVWVYENSGYWVIFFSHLSDLLSSDSKLRENLELLTETFRNIS